MDHIPGRPVLLADGFATAALSCIGSPLTAAIYRQGTTGAAKSHLEATALRLDERLGKTLGGRAVTSVNAAAVTQSSTAIPGIALYLGLLHVILGDAMVTPIGQLVQLWDQLTGARPLSLDDEGRSASTSGNSTPPCKTLEHRHQRHHHRSRRPRLVQRRSPPPLPLLCPRRRLHHRRRNRRRRRNT